MALRAVGKHSHNHLIRIEGERNETISQSDVTLCTQGNGVAA